MSSSNGPAVLENSGVRDLSDSRQLLVGALKFLVFILCIIFIPFALGYFGLGLTSEEQMGVCLFSWVIAIASQWVIGKAFDSWVKGSAPQGGQPVQPYPPQPSYGQQPQYATPPQQYGQVPDPGPSYPPQPYPENFQEQPREPCAPSVQSGPQQSPVASNVCRRCGGPLDPNTRKCRYCKSQF